MLTEDTQPTEPHEALKQGEGHDYMHCGGGAPEGKFTLSRLTSFSLLMERLNLSMEGARPWDRGIRTARQGKA